MPIHFNDVDIMSEVSGLDSVLIVPCYMCPAVTVAIRENKPFIQLFKGFFRSPPFAAYIRQMQSRLNQNGIRTHVFKSFFYHQWFMCIWTARRRKKLRRHLAHYSAVIVLGCSSATETVRQLAASEDCKVIEAMKPVGITNAKPRFCFPCNIYFEDGKTVPYGASKAQ